MKRMLIVWAAATLMAAPVYGQSAAPERPPAQRQSETSSAKSDRARLEAGVRYLADDSLEGREAGTTGYALAAGYVAGQFAALGIKPAGNDGTYFQSVPMVSSRLKFGGKSDLQITDAQGAAVLPESSAGEDYFTFPKRGKSAGEVEGELVFVGYGFAADGYEQDDFAGIDLNGKIAVVVNGAPPTLNSEERAYYSNTKSQRLSERGAVGIITQFTPTDAQRYTFDQLRGYLRSTLMSWAQPDGTVFSLAPGIQGSAILGSALSQSLFEGQPVSWEDVDAYQSGKLSDLPSFDMGLTARITGESTVGAITSPNVIGMIPGTDPSVAFGAERSTLSGEVEAATASQGIALSPDPAPEQGIFARSDQYSFVQQGVPAIFLVTGTANGGEAAGEEFLANHYHKASDEVGLIDFEQLGRFTDVNYAIIRGVANMAEKPVWKAGDFFAKTFGGEMEE